MKITFHGFTFCVHIFIITSSLFLQIHTIDTTSPTNIVSPAFPPTRPIRLGPALSWGPARSEDPYYNSRSKSYVFDVTNFGAVGDGPTDDTAAFRSAWKAACQVEKGVVFARSGLTFTVKPTIFSGPCQRGLVFQVDGVLMPPDGPDHWPEPDGNNNHWLLFDRVSSMSLTGTGTIEGHGQKWWNLPCKPHKGPNGSTLPGPCFSPTLISFYMSSNLVVSGLRIQNSPQVNVKFDDCESVLIDKLSISAPKLSPNTDGIHIENTKSVGIYHSVIANGDDCISIGSGSSDVHIEGVTCGPSHGISIGSLGLHNTRACVSNVTVRNSVIRDSDNGLRVKTWQGGSGSVSGLTFENIQMENVKNCILIDQYYCLTNDCRNQTSAVHVNDVTYKNVKGRCDVSMSPPVNFACSDAVPCTNIAMSEVELLPYGSETNDPFCWNAYGVQKTKNVPPIDCLKDGTHESVEEYYGCSGGAGRVNLFDFIE